MARKFIVGAVIYFVLGVLLGMGMSITENHLLTGVHAHINLLGWVSLALGGILYHLFPAAGNSALGKWHFWTHMIGLPVMMIGLACLLLTENTAFIAPISIGGVLVVVGTILFAANVIRYAK